MSPGRTIADGVPGAPLYLRAAFFDQAGALNFLDLLGLSEVRLGANLQPS